MAHRSTSPSARVTNARNSQAPTSTSLDVLIGHSFGSSVALEATPAQFQASKHISKPTLSPEIEQPTRENGYLRQELACRRKMHEASLRHASQTLDLVERLRRVNFDYRNTQREIDIDFCKPASA